MAKAAKPDPRVKEFIGMRREEYLQALEDLGLQPQSRRTAKLLGLSVRQAQRIATGEQHVTDTVARLIGMYQRCGIPIED